MTTDIEIEIDDALLQSAMKALGSSDVRDTVEQALRMLIERRRAREAIMNLYGTVEREDDVDAMPRTHNLSIGG